MSESRAEAVMDKELLSALGKSELFMGLGQELGRRLSFFSVSFSRGEPISELQNGVDCVGIIVRGCAEVLPGLTGRVSIIGPGSEFGICNIFIREDMPTELRARSSCRAAFMPKEVFAELLGKSSTLMYRYVRLCNEKMLYLARKLRLMSIPDCQRRLAFWLGRSQTAGEVRLTLSRDELATSLGMSRSTLFRAMRQLEGSGIIRVRGERILITDPDSDIFKEELSDSKESGDSQKKGSFV